MACVCVGYCDAKDGLLVEDDREDDEGARLEALGGAVNGLGDTLPVPAAGCDVVDIGFLVLSVGSTIDIRWASSCLNLRSTTGFKTSNESQFGNTPVSDEPMLKV